MGQHFNENEHGLWRAHCYSFMPGTSTFIVECTEDTWRRAGLENATEAGQSGASGRVGIIKSVVDIFKGYCSKCAINLVK